MKIWIDADAAPFEVKEIIFRAARRLNVETIMVANQSLALPLNAPMVSCITVSEGANMADRFIAKNATGHDLVITADIPLAGQLVESAITVIDPRGEIYTADNIAARLSVRNFFDDLRGAGETLRGNRPYSDRDKQAFASAFDRALTRALKNSGK
ncbi:MAG: YaiI/YqxD family protein, partial [Pirellulaceae bacterium]|nr:YaiI/YqxD family protein [Pirellulaceae bacterium]